MKKFSVADWFSIYRIAAIPLLIILIIANNDKWFAWFVIVSLLTDWIDGWLARKLKQESKWGSILDSIGDMGTLVIMVAGLFRFQMNFLTDHQWPMAIIGAGYVMQILISLLKFGKPTSFHTYSSKTAFAHFGAFYALLFLYGYIDWLFYLVITSLFVSVFEDLVLTFIRKKPDENVKGLFWLIKSNE